MRSNKRSHNQWKVWRVDCFVLYFYCHQHHNTTHTQKNRANTMLSLYTISPRSMQIYCVSGIAKTSGCRERKKERNKKMSMGKPEWKSTEIHSKNIVGHRLSSFHDIQIVCDSGLCMVYTRWRLHSKLFRRHSVHLKWKSFEKEKN